ncbi:5-formyltetrahydrofolate cyclo-ligase [Candidatus Bandiella numerosa]|jgi:5-formyltetrahydrofolate cyclo-ligase|uniref:5-formyltetrahydrofolate cyclo-ligase n=1 Tax=Candidatus Bandiella numerosa TaxID=2570586 RepID=UPI00249DB071|nr:5-formyltetrahydrofolate cyclo-ligase [Candidatus Bandiella numerosa]WHA05404.1 5-formyltetrahydrofolate cyclo-ligase [Candidatus Bandiella numerosa]
MNNSAYLKKKLRKNLLDERRALTPLQIEQLSQKICENFLNIFNGQFFKNTSIVACYSAFDNEPNIFPILNWLYNQGIKTTLPKITGDTIKFYEWNKNFPLIANKLNIYEPPIGMEMMPDALLIPVVGFDKDCNRLGHGYGHYDKGLSKIIPSIKIGVGYSFQEVEHIPTEKHDIKMDYIITEKFCY